MAAPGGCASRIAGQIGKGLGGTRACATHRAGAVRIEAVSFYALGVLNGKGEVVRDPNFQVLPSFPEAYELMHGKKPSGTGYEAWKALPQMRIMANKALFLPAGTPKPLLDAWREAVRKVLDDPEFQTNAAAVVEADPQFVGEAARPIIREATTLSPETWGWIKNYLKTTHNMAIQ